MILNKFTNLVLILLLAVATQGCQLSVNNQADEQSVQNDLARPIYSEQSAQQSQRITLEEINGWNYISFFPEDYNQLAKLSGAYHVKATEVSHDARSRLEVETVLVRKLANQLHQNSNGIVLDLEPRYLSLNHFQHLSFNLLIKGSNSVLPSIDEATRYYATQINQGLVDPQWLVSLLEQPAVLNFTLMTRIEADNSLKPIGRYRYYVSAIDENVDLTVTSADFLQDELFAQVNVGDYMISAVVITLDTANNKTLEDFNVTRNLNAEELFLELDLSLSNIRINYRQPSLLAKQ